MYEFAKWLLSEQRSELEILDKVESMVINTVSINEVMGGAMEIITNNAQGDGHYKLSGRLVRKALRQVSDSPVKKLITKDIKYIDVKGNKVTCKFTTNFNLTKFIENQLSNQVEDLLTEWTGKSIVCTCKEIKTVSKPIKVTATSKWGIEKTYKSVAETARELEVNSGNLWMYLFDNKNMPEATRDRIASMGWTFKTNE